MPAGLAHRLCRPAEPAGGCGLSRALRCRGEGGARADPGKRGGRRPACRPPRRAPTGRSTGCSHDPAFPAAWLHGRVAVRTPRRALRLVGPALVGAQHRPPYATSAAVRQASLFLLELHVAGLKRSSQTLALGEVKEVKDCPGAVRQGVKVGALQSCRAEAQHLVHRVDRRLVER